MRSACSGAKLDSIVVPVFSSSAYVSEGLCGVGRRLQAAMRTFARSEERDCCRYGDQCGDCQDEIGEELALHACVSCRVLSCLVGWGIRERTCSS